MLEPVFFPFPEINTGRLLLRRIVASDAAAVLALRGEESVMQYIDRELLKTMEDARAWIQIVDDALETNNGINWAISFSDQPQALIGTIGFWRIIKPHYRAEIGYMLHPLHWRKGIMKEAIQALVAYGFGTMQLHSIEAHINPANTASAAILESTGFTREAYFKEDYYFKGRFLDTAIYSLLVK